MFLDNSDLSLFEQIFLMISEFLQIFGLQPQISKVFLDHYIQIFLTVGQKKFGNEVLTTIYFKFPNLLGTKISKSNTVKDF